MGFYDSRDKSLMQATASYTYGDLLSVHWYSGSSAGDPVTLTLPDGSAFFDPFARTEIAPANYGIVSGSTILSGTWNWAATLDRRYEALGLLEGADGVFVCLEANFQVLSGAQLFAIRDNIEVELVRAIYGLTTGEVFTAWRKQRDVQ